MEEIEEPVRDIFNHPSRARSAPASPLSSSSADGRQRRAVHRFGSVGRARRQQALNPTSAGKPIALFSLCRHRTPSIEFTTGGTRATPLQRPAPPATAPGPGGHCWLGAPRGPWAGSPPLPPRRLWAVGFAMGQCLPCLGSAVKDVVETPDPVSKNSSVCFVPLF
ncbi:small VCP/p97-interacting protein isoform X2 [Parus major]|uniref:small VCP/p97-interacting protein isoform X2 n=1 Tax=Parus major TaxID=9157 RepID=UPI0014446F5B|nr:small VCP/p97-interacting protein isoform X2 [Parus major]